MSAQAAHPWTADQFAPTTEPEQELAPYRVRYKGELYDQSQFTSDTDHRYHAFVSGIGAGKTLAGLMRMAANVKAWNAGSMGAIVAPTSLAIKNAILPKLQKWGFMDTWEYHGPQSEAPGLHTDNGTRILLESANNERKIERLRGFDLAWVWIDEAAYVPERAWDVLRGRLRIGDYRNAFITTTPAGFNWVYERFHTDGDRTHDSLNTILGVPSHANPHLPLDVRRDILDDYEGQFHEQEVLGRFVKPSGLVYPWFDADSQVIESLDSNLQDVYYGVDWGFHPAPAGIIAWGKTADSHYVALEEHYERNNTTKDLARKAHDMQERWGEGTFYCDPEEPSNIETFKRNGLHAVKADNSVTPGIQHVTSLADDIRVLYTCQSLINEFNAYSWQEDGDEPAEGMDHLMDASRYALFTAMQTGKASTAVTDMDFI